MQWQSAITIVQLHARISLGTGKQMNLDFVGLVFFFFLVGGGQHFGAIF